MEPGVAHGELRLKDRDLGFAASGFGGWMAGKRAHFEVVFAVVGNRGERR